MRIVADENVPREAVDLLRAAGHDVAYGSDFDQGADDDVRADMAYRDGRVIVTEDQDFATLVFAGHPCISLIRFSLDGMNKDAKPGRIRSRAIRRSTGR